MGGIALMVGLAIMLFGTASAKIVSAPDVVRRLKEDIAGFRAGETALDADANAALIENARDGVLHLVVARGDGLVVRPLRNGIVKRVLRRGPMLSLRLGDFTLPRASLTLADEAAAQAWEARIASRA
jgi:hypothetical protein